MKSFRRVPLLLLLGSFVITGYCQKDCKVLLPAISENYIGKCKKGLAHGRGKAVGVDTYEGMFRKGLPDGKGTYTWSTGESYNGHWSEGQRDGLGVYVVKINGKDSITAGLWENNKYMGPPPKPPKVMASINVDKYRFTKRCDGNAIRINLYQNGTYNTSIEDLMLAVSSGNQVRLGNTIGFDNVTFPFECKVSYKTWNKMHTYQHYSSVEFKITEPGEWVISIYN
jgi:hypothetical protein